MLKKIFFVLISLILILIATAFFSHRDLPAHTPPSSHSLVPDPQTRLAQWIIPRTAEHPDLAGIYALENGHEALSARLLLSVFAEKSLDIQYYIWHPDTAGYLLMQAINNSADRGVRVRLLLDDNNTREMDPLLLALDNHPNIEVRVFNPFMHRKWRILSYLSDFSRLNRRMHNKSFTADGMASIVGGRNIGDEYFGTGDGVLFADLDVIAVGEVVQTIETDFDRYWHSTSSYPLAGIIPEETVPNPIDIDLHHDEQTKAYLQTFVHSELSQLISEKSPVFHWVPATLLSDDPKKGLGNASDEDTLLADLLPVLNQAEKELTIVSPYFVPTQSGADALIKIAQRGVDVTILTNSLAATDVAAVHAGYAKYRKELLEAGIHLYELKPGSTIRLSRSGGITGHSGASLHAKTFSIDGQTLFVGSFNMDPRSARLNTEMGLLLDDDELAQTLPQRLDEHLPDHSFEVSLTPQGELRWRTQELGKTVEFSEEPQSSTTRRTMVTIMSYLPIEWLL